MARLIPWKTFVSFAALTAVAACGHSPQADLGLAPNVVLISIDSLRWDGLGCYGAERLLSPEMDALAAEGALFETAFAPTSWTLPSHVTLLTGLPILGHRVQRVDDRIDENRVLLAEHLARSKYRTAGFVSAPFLDEAYGFARGFDTYENFGSGKSTEFPPSAESHDKSHSGTAVPEVIDAAIDWLADVPITVSHDGHDHENAAGAESYFLFVHLWDPHYDYTPPAPFDTLFDPDYEGDLDVRNFERNESLAGPLSPRDQEHIRALYDGEIRFVDQELGRLFKALRSRHDWSHTITSLVSDHGEEFFEHGGKGHARTLFEESVRVPWIVVYPEAIKPNTRVPGVVGLMDVAPTILGLLTAPPLQEAIGLNWSGALVNGEPANGLALLSFGELRAVRGEGWKIMSDPHVEQMAYFDLKADPLEQNPIAATDEQSAVLNNSRRAVEEHARRLKWNAPTPVARDPETTEMLQDLGYIK